VITASLSREKIISYKGDVLTGPAKVDGYERLTTEQKTLFTKFLHNFYGAWEFPENHLPVKIKHVPDEIDYLRVDFEKGGWLHIITPWQWF